MMKYIITEQQHNVAIDRSITRRFEPHDEKHLFLSDDATYWVKNEKIIAQILKKNKWFFVEPKIWEQLEKLLYLEHDELQHAIKQWLDKHYNLGEYEPLKKITGF